MNTFLSLSHKCLSVFYVYIVLIVVFFNLCACSHTHCNKYIAQLDSIADSNPTKALKEINGYERNNIKKVHDKMCLALVKYKAEDMAYINHSSDSTIISLNDYFQHNGSTYEKLICLYYLGSTYRDMHDYPYAIKWYEKACEFAESSDLAHKDSTVLAKIHSQMSEILYRIGNYNAAFRQQKETYSIEKALGTITISSLEDMGRSAEVAQENTIALKFYKEALSEIINQKEEIQYMDYLGEQLGFYITHNIGEDADVVFNIIRKHKQSNIPSNVYSSIATYYQKRGIQDSALVYMKKALALDTRFDGKAELAKDLAKLLADKGDFNESYKYSMMSLNFSDSANTEKRAMEVDNAETQRTITELNEARTLKKNIVLRKQIYITSIIILVLLATSAILLMLYINNKRKLGLQADIERITTEKIKIATDHDILKSKVLADRQLRAESATDISVVFKDLEEIADSPKEKLMPNSWNAIFNAVDKLHPDFRNHLLSYNRNLENKDIILLYIMKLGFKQADIARIFKRNPSVISRKFSKIEAKLGTSIKNALDNDFRTIVN